MVHEMVAPIRLTVPGTLLYRAIAVRVVAEAARLVSKSDRRDPNDLLSNDVRELEASANPKAAFALEYFVYRAGLFAGMLAAALRGIDAFVFTAGIGENSPTIRARIADRLSWLGVSLDTDANAASAQVISRKDSRVTVYVIPTNEELMIARHTLDLISGRAERAAE